MEEDGCPRCKTTKYRNPSLKLMVNICGHTLCENCVELLFVKGNLDHVYIPKKKEKVHLKI